MKLSHIIFILISLHYLKVITARHVIGDRLIWENPVNDYSPFLLAFSFVLKVTKNFIL